MNNYQKIAIKALENMRGDDLLCAKHFLTGLVDNSFFYIIL